MITIEELEDINFWAGVEARRNKIPYSSLIYTCMFDGDKFVNIWNRK